MCKLLYSFIIAFFTIATTTASNLTARQVLDKTATVLTTKFGAQANFSISNSKIGTLQGTIVIKKNKFVANIPSSIVWYDGKTQWTYLKNNEEVNISIPSKSEQQTINPYTFIYLYKNGYTYTMTQKNNSYVITLKGKGKSINELIITINKNTFVPSQICMKQGKLWTTIAISNFKSTKLSDAIFRFNAKDFPKAEIIDLR